MDRWTDSMSLTHFDIPKLIKYIVKYFTSIKSKINLESISEVKYILNKDKF